MADHHAIPLNRFVFREFFKTALIPLLVIELALLLLYFWINDHNQSRTMATLEQESISHLTEIAGAQTGLLSRQLTEIAGLARIVQGETRRMLEQPDLAPSASQPPGNYAFADNGVYYQTNNTGGTSLYYSTVTTIGPAQRDKAARSEVLDPIYKAIYGANRNIVAVYLNTHDSMNRYYPFIEEVAKQYLPDMRIPEFNFYYLADRQHNPGGGPVWTETYLDPAGQGWMMSCVVPIYREDFLEGVAGIDITIKNFLDNILRLQLPWGAQPFLVDAKGTIMAMPSGVEQVFGLGELREAVYTRQVAQDTFKPEAFNLHKITQPRLSQAVTGLLARESGVVELAINNGIFLLAQATEPVTGWKLMILADKTQILRPITTLERATRNYGYLAIAGMLFFYCLFFLYLMFIARRLAARISTPITEISKRSEAIARGNYTVELLPSPIFELNGLSENFTAMVDRIQALHADLRDKISRANAEIEERRQIQDALRASEQKLSAIFDHTFQLIGLLDRDGRLIGMNRTAYSFTGSDESSTTGKPFWQTPWWRHSPEARERLREAIETVKGGEMVRFETTHVRATGEVEDIDFSLNPVKDAQGQVILMIPEGRIITDLKKVEQELRQARDAAQAANITKSRFLANMSHEIRTPMNAILGMAHLAIKVRDQDKQQRYLETLCQAAESLLELLNDILDFSRMEAGQLLLNTAPFDLRRLLGEVISTLHVQAEGKGLSLVLDLDQALPPCCFGDSLRLRQILINLVGNAIKFTPTGTVTLKAQLSDEWQEGPLHLHCTVRDTGIGIPEDKLERIFTSFEQVDSSAARQYGGSGLGLAICRQLTQLMGGRIWVESRLGQGSAFHCLLPLAPCDPSLVPEDTPVRETDPVDIPSLRILIVDDNEVNRDVARLTLEERHRIQVAANGLEALRLLSEEEFDLVFMDVQMPVVDGLTATAIIRALEQGTPPPPEPESGLYDRLSSRRASRRLSIVAMTAHAMSGDRETCLRAGMDAYLTKPLLPGKLCELLSVLDLGPISNEAGPAAGGSEAMPPHAPSVEEVRAFLRTTTRLPDAQIEKILKAARASLIEMLAEAQQALAKDNLAALGWASHTLKGTLLQCGLHRWADKAQELHGAATRGENLPYAELVAALEAELCHLVAELPGPD